MAVILAFQPSRTRSNKKNDARQSGERAARGVKWGANGSHITNKSNSGPSTSAKLKQPTIFC